MNTELFFQSDEPAVGVAILNADERRCFADARGFSMGAMTYPLLAADDKGDAEKVLLWFYGTGFRWEI